MTINLIGNTQVWESWALSVYTPRCSPPGSLFVMNTPFVVCDSCLTPSVCSTPHPIYKETPMQSSENPKAARAVADGKAPLDYLESAVCDDGEARVLANGAAKYGRRNFRDTPILWTTYLGALRRHLNALHAGDDIDPYSGEHHLFHIRASTAVLLAAADAGTLVDDRHDKESIAAPAEKNKWSCCLGLDYDHVKCGGCDSVLAQEGRARVEHALKCCAGMPLADSCHTECMSGPSPAAEVPRAERSAPEFVCCITKFPGYEPGAWGTEMITDWCRGLTGGAGCANGGPVPAT